jgi:hypothetical protein
MKPARSCQTRKKKKNKNVFMCQAQKKKAINVASDDCRTRTNVYR